MDRNRTVMFFSFYFNVPCWQFSDEMIEEDKEFLEVLFLFISSAFCNLMKKQTKEKVL